MIFRRGQRDLIPRRDDIQQMKRVDLYSVFEGTTRRDILGASEALGIDTQRILGEEARPLLTLRATPEAIAEGVQVIA